MHSAAAADLDGPRGAFYQKQHPATWAHVNAPKMDCLSYFFLVYSFEFFVLHQRMQHNQNVQNNIWEGGKEIKGKSEIRKANPSRQLMPEVSGQNEPSG